MPVETPVTGHKRGMTSTRSGNY